jgi:hypothetical protein
VIDPAGRWHRNASAAAVANNLRPSTVSVNLRLGRMGWRYAEAHEGPNAPENVA